jgi:hypothetical protein
MVLGGQHFGCFFRKIIWSPWSWTIKMLLGYDMPRQIFGSVKLVKYIIVSTSFSRSLENLGSMLWSLFSAIFIHLLRKYRRFLFKNVIFFFCISCCNLSNKRHFFLQFFPQKFFQKVVTLATVKKVFDLGSRCGKVVKINEMGMTRVCSPPRATSSKKVLDFIFAPKN